MVFFKEDRKVKLVLSEGWYQWEGGRYKERVNMVKYYVFLYEYEKIRPVETILGMGGREIKENDGRGEFMLYYKHFCKCHIVPPLQQ
jgi:hypothetical protein